jgi:hypothetical protein
MVCALACAAAASAQVVNPANRGNEPSQTSPASEGHLGTWEMPPVTVNGKAPLNEEDLIGEYAQPRWTAARRFGETRVYVVPSGVAEFEFWMIPKTPKGGGATTFENAYEFEFGLPHRFQLDLYAVAHKTGRTDGEMKIDEQKFEVRWAFADWNKIWGNPTVYAEWKQESGAADHAEIKLLLGGEITSGWHWGSNLVWEHEIAGEKENSNEWTTGISRTVKDMGMSIGMETQLALVNTEIAPGTRSDFEHEFLIGPSVQFRPGKRMHLDIAPLFGTTAVSKRAKTFIVFGYEF